MLLFKNINAAEFGWQFSVFIFCLNANYADVKSAPLRSFVFYELGIIKPSSAWHAPTLNNMEHSDLSHSNFGRAPPGLG